MSASSFSGLNGAQAATGGVLDQRLSLDVQGVDALRRTVRTSPDEGMKQASKQFEVMFMQMVLKSMREATPSGGMFGGQQEKMYTSMLDQQLSRICPDEALAWLRPCMRSSVAPCVARRRRHWLATVCRSKSARELPAC